MPGTMMMIASKLSLLNLILLTMIPAGVDSHTAIKSSNLRGVQEATVELNIQRQRRLPHPHPHHSSTQSSWTGCLGLSESEKEEVWPNGPSCDTNGDGDGDNTGDEKTDEEQNYEQTDDDKTDTDPYDDFSITKCNTYENLWRWDLHMSCGGDNTNLDECDCTFAQELFDRGLLVCEDRERCPRSCPICSTCLSVLGCPEGEVSRLASSTLVYIIVGSVVFLVIALALVHSHRKKKQENDLSQQLIPGAKDKDTNDPNQDNQTGWEPPLVDSADSGGLAVPVGGAVWKNSKDESDTDDEEEETIDETLDETMLSPSVDGPVPLVATEDTADGPEDEMAMEDVEKDEDEAQEEQEPDIESPTVDGDDAILATSTIDGDETAPEGDKSSGLEETEETKDLENEPSTDEVAEDTPETSEEEEPAAESSEPSDDQADEVQEAESSDTLGAQSLESPESTEAPVVETAESADESLTR